jgi:large subunit ribosomal protein L9
MAKQDVILTHNLPGLGGESDQVRVAAGFARNYLIPQGLAIPLTAANKRRLEALRQRRAEREAHELNSMNELAKSLSKLVLMLKVKTGEDGKMFGSITAGTLADELHTQFDVALDKRKIHLEKPLRTLGDHEVELRLHHDVSGTLKVRVESLNPPEPPPESVAKPAEASERGERPRRRERTAPARVKA